MNRQKYNSTGWLNFGSNKTVKSLENSNVVYGHTTNSSISPGDEVKAGDPLVVMIAMKMEYVIKAPRTAKWRECHTGSATSFRKARNLSTLKRSSQKTDHMPPIRHTRRRNRKNLDHSITEKVEIWGDGLKSYQCTSFAKLCRQWASWFTYRWQI